MAAAAETEISTNCCKNFNVYWLAGTAIAVYFLLVYAPLTLNHVDPTFAIHLLGAYTIYAACIHNTLLTPTTWRDAKVFHVWAGRVGLVFGVVSVVVGAYLTWTRYADDLSFAIPITIGGTLQLGLQNSGYRAIRRFQELKKEGASQESCDTALRIHIRQMVNLFLLACAIPASIRIAQQINAMWTLGPFIAVLIVLARLYTARMTKDLQGEDWWTRFFEKRFGQTREDDPIQGTCTTTNHDDNDSKTQEVIAYNDGKYKVEEHGQEEVDA